MFTGSTAKRVRVDDNLEGGRSARVPSGKGVHQRAARVRSELASVRKNVESLFGTVAATDLGLTGRVPRDAGEVARYARSVISHANNAPLQTVQWGGATVSLLQLFAGLAGLTEPLESMVAGRVSDSRAREATRLARDEDVGKWNNQYQGSVGLLQALLRFAGEAQLGNNVRARMRRTAAEEELPIVADPNT